MPPETVSLEEIARFLDITPRRVAQLAAEGVIPRAQRGHYELIGSVRGYVRFLRDRSYSAEVGSEAYTTQRARLTKEKADVAEMTRLKLQEELIPASLIEEAWLELVAVMRTRLLAIPARVAARIMATPSLVEIAAIVRREVHEALECLSKGTVEATPLAIEYSSDAAKKRTAKSRATTDADDIGMGG